MRRLFVKSEVKYLSLTQELPLILAGWSAIEEDGISGVGVKSVDIR